MQFLDEHRLHACRGGVVAGFPLTDDLSRDTELVRELGAGEAEELAAGGDLLAPSLSDAVRVFVHVASRTCRNRQVKIADQIGRLLFANYCALL